MIQVNQKNCLTLAKAVAEAEKFAIRDCYRCIAGVFDSTIEPHLEQRTPLHTYLGIEGYGAPSRIARLIMPGQPADWMSAAGAEVYTKAAAVRVLEILAETGEVDWPRAIAETKETPA